MSNTGTGDGDAFDAAAVTDSGDPARALDIARGHVRGYQVQLEDLDRARERLKVREAQLKRDEETFYAAHSALDAEFEVLTAALAAAVTVLETLEG